MDHASFDRRTLLLGAGAASLLPASAWAQIAQGLSALPDLPAARPESVGLSTAGLAKINAMMADHIAKNDIQGGVTAVARRNKLVHFQAHGVTDIATKAPMPLNAEFVMMSSTKPVTGVALLQQMEAGKVSLSDPISKFIPELRTMRVVKAGTPAPGRGQSYTPDQLEPQAREITIKDLATHTSGLNGSAPRQAGQTLATYIPRLKDTPLDFQPGTKWAYSAATGPDVLARVIEICSGQPYDVYLKQHVFDPIGMTDTGHNLNPEQLARLVKRYQHPQGQPAVWEPARATDLAPARTAYFAGAYGLQSTARDYLLFETMLLNKGTIHGKQVLKASSVELMHTNLIGDLYKGLQGTTRGTGFGVLVRVVLDSPASNSNRSNGAFGWGGAYGTMSWTDPKEELVAVIMIQQAVDAVQRDFERVIREAMV